MNLTETFNKKGKRLNDTLIQRMDRVYGPDESMKVEVREDTGRIKLLAGETVVIGAGDVLQLACLISHNTFFRIGDPATEQGNSLYPTSTKEDPNSHDTIQLPNSLSDDPAMLICEELKPSSSIKVPLICRGEMAGHHTILWLFVFKIVGSKEFVGFRYILQLNVFPSLNLKPIIRPSLTKEGFYILILEVKFSKLFSTSRCC
ncbi:hypothetical protein DFH28DRAFT_1077405 [Melampsora americana]|nr:hypothetical protein DFH28DRAFT_1077405 [Melampsora americana]